MNTYWNDGTELYHYGILGQKWGVRRYQNPDGTLTEEGKKRYRKEIRGARRAIENRVYNKHREALDNNNRKLNAISKELGNIDIGVLWSGAPYDIDYSIANKSEMWPTYTDSEIRRLLSAINEHQRLSISYKNDLTKALSKLDNMTLDQIRAIRLGS